MLTVKCYSPRKALGWASFDEIVSCYRISTHWSVVMTREEMEEAGDDDICSILTINALDKDGKSVFTEGPQEDRVIYIENSSGKTVQKYEFKDMVLPARQCRDLQSLDVTHGAAE